MTIEGVTAETLRTVIKRPDISRGLYVALYRLERYVASGRTLSHEVLFLALRGDRFSATGSAAWEPIDDAQLRAVLADAERQPRGGGVLGRRHLVRAIATAPTPQVRSWLQLEAEHETGFAAPEAGSGLPPGLRLPTTLLSGRYRRATRRVQVPMGGSTRPSTSPWNARGRQADAPEPDRRQSPPRALPA